MGTLLQDLKYGLRMLAKNPGFTAVAVLTLALGIGLNTAIFSVVNAFLLRPFPYKDPAKLVLIAPINKFQGEEFWLDASAPEFNAWRSSNHVFEDMAAEMSDRFQVGGGDLPESVQGAFVSTNFFSVLGVKPILGRAFLADDGQPGQNQAVILGYGAWQRRFGSDPQIIGKKLELDAEIPLSGTLGLFQPHTVVGVLPRSFEFTKWFSFDPKFGESQIDVWVPLVFNNWPLSEFFADPEFHPLWVTGRLRPGVGLGQAGAEMTTIARRLSQQDPKTYGGFGVGVISLQERAVEDIRSALLILISAVGFVLLIACVNVASLLLARGTQRAKEISIRMAIGGRRSRLIRQLLTESVLLACLGGCFGLLLGTWGTKLLVTIVPHHVARITTVSVDGTVAASTLVISLLTGIVFGLAPALASSKPDLNQYLKEAAASVTSPAGGRHILNVLVVSEVAMAMVLLVGAGLLIKSFWGLVNADLGFNSGNLLTMKLSLPVLKYPVGPRLLALEQQLMDQARSVPGVQRVAAASPLPLSGTSIAARYTLEGRTPPPAGEEPEAAYAVVSSDYFQTMGIPILRGRSFTPHDIAGSAPVLIINQTIAKQLWPNADPIGKHLTVFSISGQVSREVVGVAGAINYSGLKGASGGEIYVPYSQDPSDSLYLVIRTRSHPTDTAQAVRLRIAGLDKNLSAQEVMTMEDRISSVVSEPRLYAGFLGTFALFALVLAAVGIYGVVAYSVTERTHEIGVRVALGAQRHDVLRLVVGQGVVLILGGVGIGCVGAWAATRLLSTFLYGVSPRDPATFLLFSILLTGVGLLACYIPARRATKVDPMVALRYE